MHLHLIAAGTRMPAWVDAGFEDYARRLPRECALTLTEIPVTRRGKSTPTDRAVAEEGRRMMAAVPRGTNVVALEVTGRAFDTPALARRLERWLGEGADVALLVGGPDGLAPHCRESARSAWSLSPLTLPHGLVRVIVAEQLYRAWSLLGGHPYHRA